MCYLHHQGPDEEHGSTSQKILSLIICVVISWRTAGVDLQVASRILILIINIVFVMNLLLV
jgi:hypothetical protein